MALSIETLAEAVTGEYTGIRAPNIQHLEANKSNVFYVRCAETSESAILKLRKQGGIDEAKALCHWHQNDIATPTVFGFGRIDESGDITEFLVMSAIENGPRRLASTGNSSLENGSGSMWEVAKNAGQVLYRMHQKKVAGGFGEISQTLFPTWNDYLLSRLRLYSPWVGNIAKPFYPLISKTIHSAEFDHLPVFAHGDYFPYNMVLRTAAPNTPIIIDPNTLYADTSYDLAIILNKLEYVQIMNTLGSTRYTKTYTHQMIDYCQHTLAEYLNLCTKLHWENILLTQVILTLENYNQIMRLLSNQNNWVSEGRLKFEAVRRQLNAQLQPYSHTRQSKAIT